MRYYLLAGEASGDLHGAMLAKGLFDCDPSASIFGWGGVHMKSAGVQIEKDYGELAFMGFVEVLRNLPTIRRNWNFAKKRLLESRPDAIILIDYPGFNLRLARWAHKRGFRVFYFISPQLWAWHTSRVEIIRRYVERMYVILPFEMEFYAHHGIEVEYHGHPLIDVVNNWRPSENFLKVNSLDASRPIIALLPGSREQEIKRILPVMLEIIPHFPEYQFVIAAADSLPSELYTPLLQLHPSVCMVRGQTYDLLFHAKAAIVKSGTASLETALFNVPQVVCYKAGNLSYRLARWLVNPELKHIAIANLIAGRTVVPELIQDELNGIKLQQAFACLFDDNCRSNILDGYAQVRAALGSPGAAHRIAERIVKRLSQ